MRYWCFGFYLSSDTTFMLQLLTSICMDMSASQRTVKAEDFIVFQDVSLLALVDINEDDTSATPGTLVITKYELVFADEKVCLENSLIPNVAYLPDGISLGD